MDASAASPPARPPSSPQPPEPGPEPAQPAPPAAVFAGEPRGPPPPPPPPAASAEPAGPARGGPTVAPAGPGPGLGPGLAGSPGYLELKLSGSGSGTTVLSVSGPDRPAGVSAAAELEAVDRALAAVGAGGRVVVDCHELGSPTCLAQIGRFQAVADLWTLHGRPAVQLLAPSAVHCAILKTLGLWHGG